MTKQDIIKQYYGEDYNKAISNKYGIDDLGYSDFYAFGNETFFINSYEINAGRIPGDIVRVRPIGLGQALKDFENNNGWIKIENEDDLPDYGSYWVVKKSGDIIDSPREYDLFEYDDTQYWLNTFTYYQPIEKPKPPIY